VLSVGSSIMTTSSDWQFDSNNNNVLEIRVEKTQVLESTLEKLMPFQLPLLGRSLVIISLKHTHTHTHPYTDTNISLLIALSLTYLTHFQTSFQTSSSLSHTLSLYIVSIRPIICVSFRPSSRAGQTWLIHSIVSFLLLYAHILRLYFPSLSYFSIFYFPY
jgi:hypothetical protein